MGGHSTFLESAKNRSARMQMLPGRLQAHYAEEATEKKPATGRLELSPVLSSQATLHKRTAA